MRRTLFVGLTVITMASLLCGLAIDGPVLITGRAVQGSGRGAPFARALSIVTTMFTAPNAFARWGIWAAIGGAAATIGVLVSGVLNRWTQDCSGVFFLNVPDRVGGAARSAKDG